MKTKFEAVKRKKPDERPSDIAERLFQREPDVGETKQNPGFPEIRTERMARPGVPQK
jgi:hypothetical protein